VHKDCRKFSSARLLQLLLIEVLSPLKFFKKEGCDCTSGTFALFCQARPDIPSRIYFIEIGMNRASTIGRNEFLLTCRNDKSNHSIFSPQFAQNLSLATSAVPHIQQKLACASFFLALIASPFITFFCFRSIFFRSCTASCLYCCRNS